MSHKQYHQSMLNNYPYNLYKRVNLNIDLLDILYVHNLVRHTLSYLNIQYIQFHYIWHNFHHNVFSKIHIQYYWKNILHYIMYIQILKYNWVFHMKYMQFNLYILNKGIHIQNNLHFLNKFLVYIKYRQYYLSIIHNFIHNHNIYYQFLPSQVSNYHLCNHRV